MGWNAAGSLKGAKGDTGAAGTTTLRGASDYDDATAPTSGQGILWVPGSPGKWAPRTVEMPANKSLPGATVPNGYIGADSAGAVPRGSLYLATASADGVTRYGTTAGTATQGNDVRLNPATESTYGIMRGRDAAFYASPVGAKGDRAAYADELSPFPRLFAAGTGGALTTLFYSAVVAGYDDSAAKVRLGIGAASAGTGSVSVGVFVGSDPTNLSRVAVASASAVTVGVLELTLSAAVSWTAGQYVVVAVVITGFSTVPTLRWLGGGGPGSALLNPSLLLAVARSSVSAMPTSLNLSTGGGSSGTPLWWALTG